MLGRDNYNYGHFSGETLGELEHARFSGPAAGESAPDFKAVTLDGGTVRLSDYRGRKNVLLVFGSVTCPMTAASIGAINELYEQFRGDDVEFLFVYVREAHPGEQVPAHRSADAKARAATLLRNEEKVDMPIVVDSIGGNIHRRYSRLPNPSFLIDRSGRVAFRSMWSNAKELAAALDELRELQRERRVEHVVVRGGEDVSMPLTYSKLYSYRALERGGEDSLNDFLEAMGRGGREPASDWSNAEPLLERPGRIMAVTALTTAVLAGGLYAGFELRKRRLGARRNPYRTYEKDKVGDTEAGTDYGAVGI
jgi:peroxiredoxin